MNSNHCIQSAARVGVCLIATCLFAFHGCAPAPQGNQLQATAPVSGSPPPPPPSASGESRPTFAPLKVPAAPPPPPAPQVTFGAPPAITIVRGGLGNPTALVRESAVQA